MNVPVRDIPSISNAAVNWHPAGCGASGTCCQPTFRFTNSLSIFKPFKDPGHWEIDATYTEAKAKADGFKSAADECAYQMKIDTDDRRCVHYTPGKVLPLMDTSWMKCARGGGTEAECKGYFERMEKKAKEAN